MSGKRIRCTVRRRVPVNEPKAEEKSIERSIEPKIEKPKAEEKSIERSIEQKTEKPIERSIPEPKIEKPIDQPKQYRTQPRPAFALGGFTNNRSGCRNNLLCKRL